jgi:acyl phosphate:glycerol-3-phosphate acyltransferase
MIENIIILISSYLLGSVPFGLVLCYLTGYGDIRKIGSGNIGATNVLRTGNKYLATLTALLDISKGFMAVLLIRLITQDDLLAALAGFASILGHNFPVWLNFKGGKGMATTFGTITAIHPIVGLGMMSTWFITALLSRISSLSALIAFVVGPLIASYFLSPIMTIIIYMICLLGIIRHHANIDRLLSGQEPKINLKKP